MPASWYNMSYRQLCKREHRGPLTYVRQGYGDRPSKPQRQPASGTKTAEQHEDTLPMTTAAQTSCAPITGALRNTAKHAFASAQ
jgi:hypothetical protein